MKLTLLSSFLIMAATTFAAGNTHKIAITQDSVIEGKTVKAGEYKLSVANGTAVLKMGKESIEVPAREVSDANRTASDELIYKDGTNLAAIRIGGSNTRIVFEPFAAIQSGS